MRQQIAAKQTDICAYERIAVQADDVVWRVAFAFDPERRAILLVAGNKAGRDKTRFYRTLIRTADARYASHLNNIKTPNDIKTRKKK